MAEIDWAALLEGKEPQPNDEESEDISGLVSVNSDISITGSTQSTRDSYRNISRDKSHDRSYDRSHDISESGSFMNLQSVNDLIGHSPSPELHGTRSATSIKSNVTFSESEPEVFNIAEELNLLSIGDLLPDEQLEGEELLNESKSVPYSSDKFTDEYSESEYHEAIDRVSIIEEEGRYTEEEEQEQEISEEIKTKSDGWKNVKDKMLNKGKKIPVFMVGPKKKKLSRDLSFSRSIDKSEISQMLSRKSSKSSLKSEAASRKSSVVSEKSEPVSYNFTSFTEDFTTLSDSSEVTKSRQSVTEIRFQQPCCKCECKNQTADVSMRPMPIFSGLTLDSKTLEELSAMNPDKIALLNMMKAQYNLTKGLIDITSSILNSELDGCKPTVRYTNYKDTQRYIAKHQPYKRKHSVKSERSKLGRRSSKFEKHRRKSEKPES